MLAALSAGVFVCACGPTEPGDSIEETESDPAAGISMAEWLRGQPIEVIAFHVDPDLVVVGSAREMLKRGAATHADPPVVRFGIEEVISGDSKREAVDVVWEPRPHDVDWGYYRKEPRYIEWAKKPMVGPRMGERYLLILQAGEAGRFSCWQSCQLPASEENVAAARAVWN